MLKHHYPKLFADAPESASAKRLAARVYELSEFLVRVLGVRLVDRGEPIRVTWHSSCHALREMQVTADAKALIGQLKNVELVELTKEHECCGFGGTFAVKHPRLSAAMVRDKVADIQATGALRLITGDCGCLMNIAGAMAAQKVPIRGQHLAEFLWERTHDGSMV
jgi:L-lactate dehydrogenase complex protein LldE